MPNHLIYANDNLDNYFLADFVAGWERHEADLAKSLGCRLTTLPKPMSMRGKSRVRYILTDPHGDEFLFGSIYAVARRLGKLARAA